MAKDAKDTQSARCLNCRAEVQVPKTFAEGDSIGCGVCGASLKVQRTGTAIRLVLSDVAPLRDQIRQTQARIGALQSDLARARASLGIGANGLGLGVLYVVVQVAVDEKPLSSGLLVTAAAIAVACGVALELANYFFLAKRREMSRLSAEIRELETEVKQAHSKIRESLRR